MAGEERSAMRTTIGERVRAYRTRRGLTQARLAHMVGRSERWLIGVEGGGVDPRVSDAVALAGVLCVGVDDLVGLSAPAGERSGRPPPRPPVMRWLRWLAMCHLGDGQDRPLSYSYVR
jgi:transcriptional regulator with XRE-family HTH domain